MQQVHTPHISRIDLAGVDGVLYHSLPAQVVTQCHGPQPRIDAFFKIAIIRRVSFADQPLPSVGVFLGGDQLQHFGAVRQAFVTTDAGRQFGPVLGHPPHPNERIDLGADALPQVAFEGMGAALRQTTVAGKTSLRGCRGREHDAIDEKFLLGDQSGHACLNLTELCGVSAEGVEYTGVVHQKLNVVAVLHGGVLVYDLYFVARRGIDEREHRRNVIGQRIGRGQRVAAVVEGHDTAL